MINQVKKNSVWIVVVSGIVAITLFSALIVNKGSRQIILNRLMPKSNVSNSVSNERVDLTGQIYIGSKPFQLVYECDYQELQGKFVLLSPVESFYPSVTLHEEKCSEYGFSFDEVIYSRVSANTKFIISSHIGDTTRKLLLTVDPVTYQLIDFETMDFGDTFYKYSQIVAWIDDTHILMETTEIDPQTFKETKTLWKAPYNDLTKKTVIFL